MRNSVGGVVPAYWEAFSDTVSYSQLSCATGQDYYTTDHLIFNAARSNATYGASATVQPSAIASYTLIKI